MRYADSPSSSSGSPGKGSHRQRAVQALRDNLFGNSRRSPRRQSSEGRGKFRVTKATVRELPLYKLGFCAVGLGFLLQLAATFALPWMAPIGVALDSVGTIAIVAKFLLNTPARWSNIMAITLWCSVVFFGALLLVLFSQGSIIYTDFFRSLSPGQQPIPFASWLAGMPANWGILAKVMTVALGLLSGVLTRIELTLFALIGLSTYAIVTVAEVAPVLLRASPSLMRKFIKALSQYKKAEVSGSQSKVIQGIAKAHDNYYVDFFRALEKARFAAYLLDVFVIFQSTDNFFLVAPWSEVRFGFSILEDVAWTSVGRAFILIGFFEVVARITINAWKGYRLSTGKAE